jgi:hypothetical protein
MDAGMRRLYLPILGLAVLLAVGPRDASRPGAEEEGGTDCGLFAVLRGDDKGELAIYDGLRKGLELARLPRVCLETIDPWPGALQGFVGRLEQAGDPGPVFAIGDEACAAVAALTTTVPRVLVVQRTSVGGVPLKALPEAPGTAVVYADVGAERLGQVLRGLFGAADVRADFPWGAIDAPDREADLGRLRRAAGITPPGGVDAGPARASLHLHLGLGYPLLPFERALEQARRAGIPLVSDDRGRFGQGAIVTLVPSQDLVGRAAAEAGRRLRADPAAKLAPHAITGIEVWVDLQSADEQGIQVPLPFLAAADKLKRGPGPR